MPRTPFSTLLPSKPAQLKCPTTQQAAARKAAERPLHALAALIQPQFVFKTLAALQPWVDAGDARAPGALRALTSFLRASPATLADELVPVGEELGRAKQYLALMQVQVGEFPFTVADPPSSVLQQRLPAGLLLALLEQADEHVATRAPNPVRIDVHLTGTPAWFALTVMRHGSSIPATDWRESMSLVNCRERLRRHFGEAAQLQVKPFHLGVSARVLIPR